MVKKRIIFILLYDGDGFFVLSRNFRLQKIGDITWLQKQYNFAKVSFFIDELVILDVTRGERSLESMINILQLVCRECFIPISVGGGITTLEHARRLFRSGADKVIVNSSLLDQSKNMIREMVGEFGSQSIVGGLDLKRNLNLGYDVIVNNGSKRAEMSFVDALSYISEAKIGEVYFNSIDKDGTGTGLEFAILDWLPDTWSIPVILGGGIGNREHVITGLRHDLVDAVATANLLNFVGDGLKEVRSHASECGIKLAHWPSLETAELSNQ